MTVLANDEGLPNGAGSSNQLAVLAADWLPEFKQRLAHTSCGRADHCDVEKDSQSSRELLSTICVQSSSASLVDGKPLMDTKDGFESNTA